MQATQRKLKQAEKQLAKLEKDSVPTRVTRRSASSTENTRAQQIVNKKAEIATLKAQQAAMVQVNVGSKRAASPAERSETTTKRRLTGLEEDDLSDLSDYSDQVNINRRNWVKVKLMYLTEQDTQLSEGTRTVP
ncbi:hypothetical protein H0H81_007761 [Sphagnurus paluster]|uniref:Uncharacterized protein n=1 Tax=Sphagnurus paluster TaxID=117069 RepID=A0A9P7KE86_9AGAR|nr:hypothetical protein H0H81_007761 [Sphagnurus paluster]